MKIRVAINLLDLEVNVTTIGDHLTTRTSLDRLQQKGVNYTHFPALILRLMHRRLLKVLGF